MFEWLNGSYYRGENFEGEVQGFNEKTNKLIVLGEDNEGNEKTIEQDLFTSGITFNIDCYNNWQEELLNALKRDNRVYIQILSTDKKMGDSWFLEIYRHKTLLPTGEYTEKVILVNCAINFCGEVKGDILSYQEKNYPGYAIAEEKLFNKWIEEQIEEVVEFNHNVYWQTFSSIIVSKAFNTDEEMKIINKLFSEKLGIEG